MTVEGIGAAEALATLGALVAELALVTANVTLEVGLGAQHGRAV